MIGESRNKASLHNLVAPLEHIGKCGETVWQETNRPQYATRTYLPTYIHTHFHIIQHPQQHYTPKKPVVVDKGYKTAQATASPCSFSALALRGREAVSLHQRGANPRLMHLHAASQLHLQMVLLARRHRGRQSSASEQSMGFGLAFLMRIIGLDYEIGADDHLN